MILQYGAGKIKHNLPFTILICDSDEKNAFLRILLYIFNKYGKIFLLFEYIFHKK